MIYESIVVWKSWCRPFVGSSYFESQIFFLIYHSSSVFSLGLLSLLLFSLFYIFRVNRLICVHHILINVDFRKNFLNIAFLFGLRIIFIWFFKTIWINDIFLIDVESTLIKLRFVNYLYVVIEKSGINTARPSYRWIISKGTLGFRKYLR